MLLVPSMFSLHGILYDDTATIGGGAYWAGRAVARPLFGPCGPAGPALSTARPLFCMILLL